MARQAARRQRLIEEASRREAAEAKASAAADVRAGLRAEREGIRARVIPGARRLEDTRQEKEIYIREKQHETAEKAELLRQRWREVEGLLAAALDRTEIVFLDDLRVTDAPPRQSPPPELSEPTERPPDKSSRPEERGWGLAALMPLVRRREAMDEPARLAHQAAVGEWSERERRRLESLTDWEMAQERDHEAFLLKQLWRDRQIAELGEAIAAGDADAIATYVAMTLERSLYPEGFPRRFDIGYEPETGLLVVDLLLPPIDVVPRETDFQYVQSVNKIEAVPARQIDRKFFYQTVVGAAALRALHEIATVARALPVQAIGLNGFAPPGRDDPPAGPPCLISVVTSPARLAELDLGRLDWRAALRSLGASVSRRTDEDPAVEPVVLRPRRPAREGIDIAALDEEGLGALLDRIADALGLQAPKPAAADGETWRLAFDDHPLIGGRVLLGLRRGSARTGADAVSAFLSAMTASGAAKGILAIEGEFSLDALELALPKPVELIDGYGLRLILGRELSVALA